MEGRILDSYSSGTIWVVALQTIGMVCALASRVYPHRRYID